MTHYVIINEWATPFDSQGITVIGVAHSYEQALKIFESQLIEEREYAQENGLTIYEDAIGIFDAGKDGFYATDHTTLYLKKVNDDEKENTNMNDLLKRLQNGETAEEIAESFTKQLNEAIEASKAADSKMEDAEELLTHMSEFFETYYPSVKMEITTGDFITLLDAFTKIPDLSRIWSLF